MGRRKIRKIVKMLETARKLPLSRVRLASKIMFLLEKEESPPPSDAHT